MPRTNKLILSLNAGELSPLMDARIDQEKYQAGCRTMENFFPLIHGGAERRPGTYYANEVKDSTAMTRLVAFEFNVEYAYVLEFGNQYIRFYKGRNSDAEAGLIVGALLGSNPDWSIGTDYINGDLIEYNSVIYRCIWTHTAVEAPGTDTTHWVAASLTTDSYPIYELVSPYLTADLFELKFEHSNDVMWITHPDYEPRKLSRISLCSWTLEEMGYEDGPFLGRNDLVNDDGVSMTLSALYQSAVEADTPTAYFSSGSESSARLPEKAFDGRTTGANCYWECKQSQFRNEYIGCQWSSGKTITKVRIWPHSIPPTISSFPNEFYNPRYVRIDASNDGSTWTPIPVTGWGGNCWAYKTDEAELGPIGNTETSVTLTLDNNTAYMYWRVFIYDVWGAWNTTIPLLTWGLFRKLMVNEIAFLEEAADGAEIAEGDDDVTLTASSAYFEDGHAPSGTGPTDKSLTGTLFKLVHRQPYRSIDRKFTGTNQTSGELEVEKGETWKFITNGTWTGMLTLERSYDDGDEWETVHEIVSQSNANETVTDEEIVADALYRMRSSLGPFSEFGGAANCLLSVPDYDKEGIVEIVSVESSTSATVRIIENPASTNATLRWAEGQWSDYRGWPACVAISPEERLCFAGSTTYPLTVWGSKVGDYESMAEGDGLDDEAIIFTLAGSGRQNRILWMISKNNLILGTVGGEHILGASSDDEAMTPSNVRARVQSNYGSHDVQAMIVNDAVLFVQKGGRKVREMSYSFERDGFVADDLTVMANHITKTGIVDWAYQRAPDPMVWCVRADGEMAVMSYEREQNVWAWCRLTTHSNQAQSVFESVAIISTPFEEDQVWAIVNRNIGGTWKRFVEFFSTRAF